MIYTPYKRVYQVLELCRYIFYVLQKNALCHVMLAIQLMYNMIVIQNNWFQLASESVSHWGSNYKSKFRNQCLKGLIGRHFV